MITVANRATPKPLTQDEQENAMTSEGAPPAGQMPDPPPNDPPAKAAAVRFTLHLPDHAQRRPDTSPQE